MEFHLKQEDPICTLCFLAHTEEDQIQVLGTCNIPLDKSRMTETLRVRCAIQDSSEGAEVFVSYQAQKSQIDVYMSADESTIVLANREEDNLVESFLDQTGASDLVFNASDSSERSGQDWLVYVGLESAHDLEVDLVSDTYTLSYTMFDVVVKTNPFTNLVNPEFPSIRDQFKVFSSVKSLEEYFKEAPVVVELHSDKYDMVAGSCTLPFSRLFDTEDLSCTVDVPFQQGRGTVTVRLDLVKPEDESVLNESSVSMKPTVASATPSIQEAQLSFVQLEAKVKRKLDQVQNRERALKQREQDLTRAFDQKMADLQVFQRRAREEVWVWCVF